MIQGILGGAALLLLSLLLMPLAGQVLHRPQPCSSKHSKHCLWHERAACLVQAAVTAKRRGAQSVLRNNTPTRWCFLKGCHTGVVERRLVGFELVHVACELGGAVFVGVSVFAQLAVVCMV
jgi:hypothetical protein